MATRDDQGAIENGQGGDQLLARRALLARGSGAAVGVLLGLRLGASDASGAVRRRTIHLEAYGAAGNGRADDTAMIQRAIDAAPSGTTVRGKRGKVYVVNGAISFPRDYVTLDLGGATIRTGRQRTGDAATSDTIFVLRGRTGVRITNGAIGNPLSPFGKAGGEKIVMYGSYGCAVDRLRAQCAGSQLVTLYAGGWHRIERNRITAGSIGGFACNYVVVKGNVLERSPYNALGFAGYRGAPATHNQYVGNVIRRWGRVAIEDTSPDGVGNNYGAVIRGNLIYPPAGNASSGTAISAISTAALIESNDIRDATGYAIEANGQGTRILGNRISWHAPALPSARAPAIIINSSTPGAPPAIVSGNRIVNAAVGITVYASPYLGPVTIEHNEIQDAAWIGIGLVPPSGTFSAPTCAYNTVSFSVPAPSSRSTRMGIQTTTGTQLIGNRISYGRHTYSRQTFDVPIVFEGDGVTANGNVVVSHRRTPGHLACRSLYGTWRGWSFSGNQFLNGVVADLSNLIRPVLKANIGPLTL